MKVYFISGLGANEKVFKKIQLPKNFDSIYLHWIEPLDNETLESYAKRLAQKIDTKEEFILIGLSLGGMIAIEISKLLQPLQTILISSAKNKHELSKTALILGKLRLHRILPEKILHSINFFTSKIIGLQSKEDEALAKEMVVDTSPLFFRWACEQIIQWKNDFIPENMMRLHGTADNIIPFPKDKNVIPIKGGTHFMVFNKANEINKILQNELKNME